MKIYKCSCNLGPDDDDRDYDWTDGCSSDELSCEDGDNYHWNSDLG